MGLIVLTEPVEEPLTTPETKKHLRIDSSDTDHDVYISSLIQAVRQDVEKHLGRSLVSQQWEWTLDRFEKVFKVPFPRLISVEQISYIDSDGVTQVLATTEYKIDIKSYRGRIVEAYNKTWPTVRQEINAVTIKFTSGYGASAIDVPMAIKQAMLLMVGHYFENREDIMENVPKSIPKGADNLLIKYMVHP